jgi:hydroxyethylthiazole kinase-like sugar kinase family protein
MLNDQIASALARIRRQKPLIHHITNLVVMNDTANLTLHLGALPVMAHAVEEVADMTGAAAALVLNLGTLTPARAEAMNVAGKVANAAGAPIVLDPVGVGATRLRTETAQHLLQALEIAIVRGNAGEIASLARCTQGSDLISAPCETASRAEQASRKVQTRSQSQEGESRSARPSVRLSVHAEGSPRSRREQGESELVRGVESVAQVDDPVALARTSAQQWGAVVAITGARDVLSDGTRVLGVDNGHRWLTTVTGTGCMASAAIAAFVALEPDPLIAAAAGLVALGLAAERAAKEARGPASFKVALLDAVYGLTPEDLRAGARIVRLGE